MVFTTPRLVATSLFDLIFMRIQPLALDGLLLLEPTVHHDSRGFFLERFNQRQFAELTGVSQPFVQDNHSHSKHYVLRGLHFQLPSAQGKLVQVIRGHIYDVVVDLRPESATFGKWLGTHLKAESSQQLWIPTGFAHGFLTLSATADVFYKTTGYYAPEHEHCLRWDDAELNIDWGVDGVPLLSDKDSGGLSWGETVDLIKGVS